MSKTIASERFASGLLFVLEEAFEQVHGVFLDKGTSLFETLTTISAEEASRPVGNQCATLAAQVAHIRFYIDLTEKYMLGNPQQGADWDEIWRTVGSVTSEEWGTLQMQLKDSYERVRKVMQNFDDWDKDERLGGAVAIVVHTAYHLGEIRQALCVLRPAANA